MVCERSLFVFKCFRAPEVGLPLKFWSKKVLFFICLENVSSEGCEAFLILGDFLWLYTVKCMSRADVCQVGCTLAEFASSMLSQLE